MNQWLPSFVAGFLVETLVWTGLLIGLVLLLRRPVARWFGPGAAYALWLLPLTRLAMPPLVLPAWLAPERAPAPLPESSAGALDGPVGSEAVLYVIGDVAAAGPGPIAWGPILIVLWLTGAAIFLISRFSAYFRMRRDMLAQACPVGEAGAVRLVETPAATAPVAFGVIDKVVALPPGFMALQSRQQRDLALAHELAHHAARDLLVNILIQPLFALHWFNPLAWLGWRALRRDQEAACDARVIAQRSAEERATYAAVIASFAAGPAVSLAAPMACPVLGEKSIIHRLRSLTMTDISPRRRMAGRALLGVAVLALPLTASISYAETMAVPAPPEAPEPPAAPSTPLVQDAPQPPAPPAPPSAEEILGEGEFEILTDDVEGPDKASGETRRVIVMRSKAGASAAPADREVNRVVRVKRKAHADGEASASHVEWTEEEHRIMGEGMSDEEREKMRRELREGLADMKQGLAESRRELLVFKNEHGDMTRLQMDCQNGSGKSSWKDDKGTKVTAVCHTEVMASALTGLKEAREAIAKNPQMRGEIRAEVLKALDEAIAEWKSAGS